MLFLSIWLWRLHYDEITARDGETYFLETEPKSQLSSERRWRWLSGKISFTLTGANYAKKQVIPMLSQPSSFILHFHCPMLSLDLFSAGDVWVYYIMYEFETWMELCDFNHMCHSGLKDMCTRSFVTPSQGTILWLLERSPTTVQTVVSQSYG